MANILDILDSFEIEIDASALTPTVTVDDVFYLQDLKQRRIYLCEEITDVSVSSIIRHIMQYNSDDKRNGIAVEQRNPILLYISSIGGSVDAGFSLIDAIENSKTPVYTVNTGFCYSMGFLIAISGKKRYATKNAKYLIHDGSEFAYNSSSKLRDQLEFYKKQDERIKQYVLSHSKLTSKEYDKNLRVEWYMFSDEAKIKGFVDEIIGVDVDLDEII